MKIFKKLYWIIFLIIQAKAFAQLRNKQLINQDWKYVSGEQLHAEEVSFDDRKWVTVQLPHDASIYGPFVKGEHGGDARNGYRPRNIGWYRKHLHIEKLDTGKLYILEFEGVCRAAKVWVNGNFCGQFLNGHLDFEFDITDKLKSGDNLIAVRYDNTDKESARWYTGEGINRNVYLHTFNKIHVARYGTYIITPSIKAGVAKTVIETEIDKVSRDSVRCRLLTEIISPSGQNVVSASAVADLIFEKHYTFHQELNITDPAIWDLNSPQMYKAVTKLYKGNKLVDVYETPFGIREIEFNNTEGFCLNGKKVFLKGVCLHEDLGPLGTASFEAAWDKRLNVLKNELGCNALRLSHNPYPKYVLDWCNRNGMLVFDEAYDKWNGQYYGKDEDFIKHWPEDVTTFIKRDRNNPSVIIWSVGNEVIQQIKGVDNFGVDQLEAMSKLVHQLDPSRKVTAALFPARWSSRRYSDSLYHEPAQMAFHMDVMSVNYQEKYFGRDRQHFPQLILMESEMSTGMRGENFFNYNHDDVAGQFYWGGTEYIGESFGWPSKGWISGLIDLTDQMKPIAYSVSTFYKPDRPMVFGTVIDQNQAGEKLWNNVKIKMLPSAPHWNWAGKDSVKLQVYSNCEDIELRLNGKLLSHQVMKPAMQNYFTIPVAYLAGELIIEGKNKGIVVAKQTLKTAGAGYKILLEPDRRIIKSNGLDLDYFRVKVVDKDGIMVPGKFDIKFDVSGKGSIAGVGNGDISSDEFFQANHRSTYNGECQLIVRSQTTPGEITVRATSPQLHPAIFTIKTE